MRGPRLLKLGCDQAVECDLHEQIEVELAEGPQYLARATRSELTVPQPRDQRVKVPRGHESRRDFERRLLLERAIIC